MNNNGKTEYVEIVDKITNIAQSFVVVKTNNLRKKNGKYYFTEHWTKEIVTTYVNGMTASKRAFSWTCQPNINEVKPHRTRHRIKSNGFLIDIQSLYKHGWKHKQILNIFDP